MFKEGDIVKLADDATDLNDDNVGGCIGTITEVDEGGFDGGLPYKILVNGIETWYLTAEVDGLVGRPSTQLAVAVGDRVRVSQTPAHGAFKPNNGAIIAVVERFLENGNVLVEAIEGDDRWDGVSQQVQHHDLTRIDRTPTINPPPIREGFGAIPLDTYHGRKADAGKADYTILPAEAVETVLQQESWLYSEHNEDGMVATPNFQDALAASVEALFAYRTSGELEDLLNAYVFSCRDRVVESLAGVVGILEYGVLKYARDSWREVPEGEDRYFSAALRHAYALSAGHGYDVPAGAEDAASKPTADGKHSGMHHWDHFRCNVLFLIGLHLDNSAE
ncbi:MAG: hypothetical protein RLZZ450_116 [Pseudomonadota bacterium]|jgi:hypothetical protein